MPTMRALQVSRPGGPLELVERPIPKPAARSVRIKVLGTVTLSLMTQGVPA
jgi:hypothetical protein